MTTTNLGRLRKVDLREVWQSESAGFTPWLAQDENLKLLGETIGIDLELEAQEKDVGPFRADLLCKDTSNEDWVLIENQLERTDHTHLGQLLTYAAGLEAVTIVWISQRFTEEIICAQPHVLVKGTILKHGCPPDQQEKPAQTALERAEILSGQWAA